MTATQPSRTDIIEVRNPADGKVVGAVPVRTADEVAAMVRELRLYQTEWEAIGAKARGQWLMKFQDWMLDNSARIADVLQSETSKPRFDAELEAPMVVDMLAYYAKRAPGFLKDSHPSPHSPLGMTKKLTLAHRPYPVVGVITPWNFPLAMPGMDIPPALAAGCAVLLKPSEITPLSGVLFVEGWKEIGAPPVLEVATGLGATGAAVVENVDYVQFTGSTRTGKAIAKAAAERLIPYSLELGGKDPAIVLADADIDRAAHGIAWGGLFNSGQVCISVERVYVEEAVHDEFVTKLAATVGKLRQGQDARDFKFDVGALATADQVQIVKKHVDDAIADGARALTGGKPRGDGNFFEPTVLVDVEQSMSCIREETFGPTIPVVKVADEAEAIRLANDSDYGLSATVWTRDAARGQRIASQLHAGAVNINDAFSNMMSYALPMGGWKESGIGARMGGASAVLKYTRAQAITTPRIPVGSSELTWFPYSKPKARFAFGAMRAGAARGLRKLGIAR